MNVIPVGAALVRPTRARIMKVSWRVNMVQFVFYTAFGAAGYLAFLKKTPSNILTAFPADEPTFVISRSLLSCGILSCLAMNLHPAVQCLIRFFAFLRGSQAPRPSQTTPAHSARELDAAA